MLCSWSQCCASSTILFLSTHVVVQCFNVTRFVTKTFLMYILFAPCRASKVHHNVFEIFTYREWLKHVFKKIIYVLLGYFSSLPVLETYRKSEDISQKREDFPSYTAVTTTVVTIGTRTLTTNFRFTLNFSFGENGHQDTYRGNPLGGDTAINTWQGS